MGCPTCDHTMRQIGEAQGADLFWCPRCGSWSVPDDLDSGVPKLVERCRNTSEWFSMWTKLGIVESINLPDKRPTESA